MKATKYNILTIAAAMLIMASCDPIEVRDEMGKPLNKSELKFNITQEEGYDNKVTFVNNTPRTLAFWDYELGTSNEQKTTIILPFEGEYKILFTAYGQGGPTYAEPQTITVSQNDPEFFDDPAWEPLTNNSEGRYWQLWKVTLGPASIQPPEDGMWADPVNWWPESATHFDDSCYFDLNKGFNYIRYHEGEAIESTFTFNSEDQSIMINGDNQMAVKDGSDEMAEENKTKYRLYYVDEDLLIVGQGAYYTSDRPDEDWGYYHWYNAVN